MLSKKLIEKRINNFWGYGDIASKIWFIGMEEGFDGGLNDLKSRFDKTKDKNLIDLKTDMSDVHDHKKWFEGELPNMQKTWRRLILILLTLESDKKITNDEIKKIQKDSFGRSDSNHCLLEFMPLPCKSTKKKDWVYDEVKIEYLETRKKYIEKIMPLRIELFQKLIEKHDPKIIICYSFSYLKKWGEIINCSLSKGENFYYCKKDNTKFFVIPHPAARGITNEEWEEIARNIKQINNYNQHIKQLVDKLFKQFLRFKVT